MKESRCDPIAIFFFHQIRSFFFVLFRGVFDWFSFSIVFCFILFRVAPSLALIGFRGSESVFDAKKKKKDTRNDILRVSRINKKWRRRFHVLFLFIVAYAIGYTISGRTFGSIAYVFFSYFLYFYRKNSRAELSELGRDEVGATLQTTHLGAGRDGGGQRRLGVGVVGVVGGGMPRMLPMQVGMLGSRRHRRRLRPSRRRRRRRFADGADGLVLQGARALRLVEHGQVLEPGLHRTPPIRSRHVTQKNQSASSHLHTTPSLDENVLVTLDDLGDLGVDLGELGDLSICSFAYQKTVSNELELVASL